MKPKLKKFLIITPLSLIILLGIFFLYLSSESFVRSHVLPVLEEKTQFTIEVDSINVSLISGSVELTQLNAHSGPNNIKAEKLELKVQTLACLQGDLQIDKATLNGASINLSYDSTGKLKADPNKAKTISLKKEVKRTKPKKQPVEKANLFDQLYALPKQLSKELKPIELPNFLLHNLSVSDTNIKIAKDDRYGKADEHLITLNSLQIQKLGPNQDFDIIYNGSYARKKPNQQHFTAKSIHLKSSGTFNESVTNAHVSSSLKISEFESSQMKDMNHLSLNTSFDISLIDKTIKIAKGEVSCTEREIVHSKAKINALINEERIEAEVKVPQLNASLLNIALNFAPKSRSLERWFSKTKKVGHKTGFADSQIKGDSTFLLTHDKLISKGEFQLNKLPMSIEIDEKLKKDFIDADFSFKVSTLKNSLDNLELKIISSDSQGNKVLNIDSSMVQETISADIKTSNLDLSLVNNFSKEDEKLAGKLYSRIKFKRTPESTKGSLKIDLNQLQFAQVEGKSLTSSLSFDFIQEKLQTSLENLTLSLQEKTSGQVQIQSEHISIISTPDFAKNTVNSKNLQVSANILESPTIPKQSISVNLQDLELVQTQENIQSKSDFTLNGAKLKTFNNISTSGSLELNANLINQNQVLTLQDLGLKNTGKDLLKIQSLYLNRQQATSHKKVSLHIPKLNILDIQEVTRLMNNTEPSFKPQSLSSEIKLDLELEPTQLSAKIELPSIHVMNASPFNLAANFIKKKEALEVKNLSLVHGPHVLNLNASMDKNKYRIDNFNGRFDLSLVHAIIKQLNPNFENNFSGMADFKETKFASQGTSPEEIFAQLQKGKIDWKITDLKINLEQEEKTFISKNLGFKPSDLHFEEGQVNLDFNKDLVKLNKFKLMGQKGGFDFSGKVYKEDQKLKSQFFTWSAFVGSEYLHLISPQTILDNINELDDFLDFNKENQWYEFDESIELLSQAEDGQFSTLLSQIQFNAESKFGPYIKYLDSAKNLSEGKLNKQSANSILDIFKQREEERQKEREEKGKKKKESKTKRALDILDGLLN
ncbi:hypothetical protein LNTAR_03494 [Lentisphaera araneosa HTCC2155]|uniref:Uncharacterized protein n=1 Tax=Lentisphaera araneosa HTCC2155 TaxID=313628 RepID=A6DSQ7_9BACT|nr:hypothetical protein [Lentisphaera araneosa]EDM25310.1 hypothetical protein LNTAR_03494 [Lentisphaera araneosa HTCC2155]